MRITQPRDDEPIRLICPTGCRPGGPHTDPGHRYRITLDVAQKGAPRQQRTWTRATIKEAREHVTKVRAGIASGSYVPPNTETVTDLCTRWMASRRDIRPVTLEGYRSHLAPVIRRIGSRRVQTLTLADVEAFTGWLAAEGGTRGQALSPRSVKAALVALGQALDMAQREGTVTTNVARLARRPRLRSKVGTDLHHWQPAELLTFIRHADTDPLAAAWRLTCCGMTRADVLGLRWSDIDMAEGVARISQGRVALDKGDHVDDPKSAARRRAVPFETMHRGTVALLRSLSARQAGDRLRAGSAYVESGLVVVDALGQPLRSEVYSDRFRRLARAAGVPPINLHSVRHSLAFWLHREGVTPADAAALLGHTVEVHLATYLPHSGASGIASAAQALGRAAAAE